MPRLIIKPDAAWDNQFAKAYFYNDINESDISWDEVSTMLSAGHINHTDNPDVFALTSEGAKAFSALVENGGYRYLIIPEGKHRQ